MKNNHPLESKQKLNVNFRKLIVNIKRISEAKNLINNQNKGEETKFI